MTTTIRVFTGMSKAEARNAVWDCRKPDPFCWLLSPNGVFRTYDQMIYQKKSINNPLADSSRARLSGCRGIDADLSRYPDIRFTNRVTNAFINCVRRNLQPEKGLRV